MTIHSNKSIAYRVLDCFPSGSYALPGLLRLLDIEETQDVPTAAVQCRIQPKMFMNPCFVDRWASTPEKLLMLVMHELHHVLLGHTRLFPTVTAVDNLVFDAVINALLCRMFPAREFMAFFTDYYHEEDFPHCLLRPPTDWEPQEPVRLPAALQQPGHEAVAGVYAQLYSEKGASYHDLYEALREHVSESLAAGVPLIGGHGHDGRNSTGGSLDVRSPVLFDAVRSIVEKWPQPPDPIEGRSLDDLLKEEISSAVRIPSNRTILRRLISKVADRSLLRGRMREASDDVFVASTPIPVFDRRSVVLTSLGSPPLLHQRELQWRRVRPVGERVHVYIDVSGSIAGYKSALYGAVLDCREAVHPIVHLFSTVVVDVSLKELRRGKCETTNGTDIACVAQHLARHRIRRAVIITDGYVGVPGGEHADILRRTKLGVALTPDDANQSDLGEVVRHWITLADPRSN